MAWRSRARAAMNYLVAQGSPRTASQLISYGKERRFGRENGEACWAQNRRDEFLTKGALIGGQGDDIPREAFTVRTRETAGRVGGLGPVVTRSSLELGERERAVGKAPMSLCQLVEAAVRARSPLTARRYLTRG